MHAIVETFSVLTSIVLVALCALEIRRWLRTRDRTAGWVTLAFLSLALIVTVGRFIPAHPHGFGEHLAQKLNIELLVLFPYLLYRFATEFVPPGRRLRIVVAALTVGLTIWTFALRDIPAAGESRSAFFTAYIVVFLAHWTILSIAVTRRLWTAGNEQPSVAATRMRLLAFASAALTVAIIGVAFSGGNTAAAAITQAMGFVASLAFFLGLEPPGILRTYWRRPENERMQEAIRGLMTLATTRGEIAHRVLGPSAHVVGARGAALYDANGELLATYGVTTGPEEVRIEEPGVVLLAWTSPYAPFFGSDEIHILETIAALSGLALDRVRLFEQEHESRLVLERANELMTNFVALAAHELRTPVTTVHGFVQTLNHLGDRLSEEQKDELRLALEQQTARMASLVEQLLDLSRLDAEAVVVTPQRVDVRQRLEEVVAVAAGSRADEVELAAPELTASVDPAILDHIVTNLVTNALRYGKAPVRVSASAPNGNVIIVVEDAGPGVAHEIEETLFERFTRAGVARDRVAGTGLGLAIARAYARAHSGDLRYEPGQPTGARFVVNLPAR